MAAAARTPLDEVIRLARLDEVPALNGLIHASAIGLSNGYYTPDQVAALNANEFGVDSQLIVDGTYFVVEHASTPVACGGWGRRKTLHGGDQARDGGGPDPLLDPAVDAARIRAFFVHPSAARQGVGRRLLAHVESAAQGEGFTHFELMGTLPGEPLYAVCGYRSVERIAYRLRAGIEVELIRMVKP